jgi:serine/threonine protein phosphatase PrpC
MIRLGFGTRRGDRRSNFEDALVVDDLVVLSPTGTTYTVDRPSEELHIFAVFDGVGGAARGEVASVLAAVGTANANRERLAADLVGGCDRLLRELS